MVLVGQGCTPHNLFVFSAELRLFLLITAASDFNIFFCIASVLLQHTEPSLLPHICLAVFILNILIQ